MDGKGLPLVTMITPGQSGDSPMLIPLLDQLRVGRPVGRPRTRPDALRGDKAYSSRAIRSHLRGRGIKAVIPEPGTSRAIDRVAAHAAAGPSTSTPLTTGTAT